MTRWNGLSDCVLLPDTIYIFKNRLDARWLTQELYIVGRLICTEVEVGVCSVTLNIDLSKKAEKPTFVYLIELELDGVG